MTKNFTARHSLTLFYLLVCILSFSYLNEANAQIQQGGEPYSWKLKSGFSQPVPTIDLPKVNIKQLLEEDEITEQYKDIPVRFAYAHAVSISDETHGIWREFSNGSKVWQVSVQSKGALSLNLTFDRFYIPKGGLLYIYNQDRSQLLGAFTHSNNKKSKTFATSPIRGDQITLEYYQNLTSQEEPELSISHIAHDYKGIHKKAKVFGSSQSCNNNVICSEWDEWRSQISSVCLTILANGTRWCTGAMIANTSRDNTPYFLTANHCLENEDPSTWVFHFNYQSPDCATSADGNLSQSVANSELISARSEYNPYRPTDFALLKLSSVPPEEYNVFYSGWDRDTLPQNQAVIHHPSGDVKKITIDNNPATKTPDKNYWEVIWEDGTTEPGSSGSPLYNEKKRIIGQLFGGYASCEDMEETDEFGRLDYSWDYSESDERLKEYLDPATTNEIGIDGYYPQNISSGAEILNFIVTGQIENTEINSVNHEITIKVPTSLDLTAVDPAMVLSPGASISPSSTTIDLSSLEFNYQVTSQDNSTTHQWKIIVLVQQSVDYSSPVQLSIFPNPANNFINLRTTNMYLERYTVYSSLGREIQSNNLTNLITEEDAIIDVRNLSSGLYFIEVIGNRGKYTSKFEIIR